MPRAVPSPVSVEAGPDARGRAAILTELRRRLPQLETVAQGTQTLPFGLLRLDQALLRGGLALDALHEIVPETAADLGAALGFLCAILSRTNNEQSIVIVQGRADAAQRGQWHGHGLQALGLDPARLLLVQTGEDVETLWAMEEVLRSGAAAAVAGFPGPRGLDLKASRRLHLAAAQAGLPLFLVLSGAGASAAATRWRIGAAPAGRDRFGLVERWRWRAGLERCRNGRTGQWIVEWDHGAHRFSLAAALADPALPGGAAVHAA